MEPTYGAEDKGAESAYDTDDRDNESSASLTESKDDVKDIVTDLDKVKRFLGSGAPLENLRAGLRSFVSPRIERFKEKAAREVDEDAP